MEMHNKVHGAEEQIPEMTGDEFDEMLERHADWVATVH